VVVIEFRRHSAATRWLCLKGQCWDFRLVFFMNQVPKPLLLTPVVNFPPVVAKKNSEASGNDSWKKQKSKISWYCPFKHDKADVKYGFKKIGCMYWKQSQREYSQFSETDRKRVFSHN
jgi:hypothetical protein